MRKSNDEMLIKKNAYTIFIKGETIDLCVPSKLAIFRDGWADWFNDRNVTKYLDQGIFPNTVEDQLEFYESLKNKTRLLLLIKPKRRKNVIGVISLSNINFYKKDAQISIVLGIPRKRKNLYALESMARLTEHGFELLGLQRIYAGQVYPGLKGWNKRLELLGYKSEGINRKAFVKGNNVYDTVTIACLREDYLNIKKLRKGKYWLGKQKMQKLIDALPKKGFAEILDNLILDATDKYFSKLKYV